MRPRWLLATAVAFVVLAGGYFVLAGANLATSAVAGVLWTALLVGGYRYLTRPVDVPDDRPS